MYHTTGFTKSQIQDLCDHVRQATQALDKPPWPPILGLYRSVAVSLTYMRRNRVQAEIAEMYDVSQPTISRAITRVTPILEEILREYIPAANDLRPTERYLVDGTLLPCWSWRSERALLSGKTRTTGLSIQVACTLSGELVWTSAPVNGNRHDAVVIQESGLFPCINADRFIGDKGYVGLGMATPYKKPKGGKLEDWQKKYNREIARMRAPVERVIANIKTWRILHTDYRRPLSTFRETISCTLALHFYKMSLE
jgi:hypothetical protein